MAPSSPRWQDVSSSLRSRWLRGGVYLLVCLVIYEALVMNFSTPASSRVEEGLSSSPDSFRLDDTEDVDFSSLNSKPIANGRVLVTGGGGNIGKSIVRRLLASNTPVTILDTIYYPDELPSSLSKPSSHPLLKVQVGDIRNTTALSLALTPDIVGVVHLAAVSRVAWCLQNEPDCMDVNERGTGLVFDALSSLNAKDASNRWFILASSREVYGDAREGAEPFREDDGKHPANTYGASKLAAERVIERLGSELISRRAKGRMDTVALRLSNVYGGVYDHLERLVPSITTQAMAHQVIQISGGGQNFDMLHINDCVDAFVLAIQHLTSLTSPTNSKRSWSLPRSSSSPSFSFSAYNIASGHSAKIPTLVNTLISLTNSKSPIRYISADARYPNVYRGDTSKAHRTFGFKARIGVQEGLRMFVEARLRHAERFFSRKIAQTCSSPSPSPSSERPPIELDLQKLNGCLAHVDMDVGGEFAGLAPPEFEEENEWALKPLTMPNLKHPIRNMRTLVVEIPPPGHSDSSSPWPTRADDGKGNRTTMIRLRGWEAETYFGAAPVYLGIWTHPTHAPLKPGPVSLGRITEEQLKNPPDEWTPRVDWELVVNPDAERGEVGTLKLILPAVEESDVKAMQLMSPGYVGGRFFLREVEDGEDVENEDTNGDGEVDGKWNVRLTPTCCPSPAPWPFFQDDPVEWSVQYQRTSISLPFSASPAKALCSRLARAKRKVQADRAALPPRSNSSSHPQTLSPAHRSRKLSHYAFDWAHASRPACSNICDDDHPTVCVDTGDCQCVLASCVPRQRFPFADHAFRHELSFPAHHSKLTLEERVAAESWKSIVRPQVASYFSSSPDYPHIFVPEQSPSDVKWLANLKGQEGERLIPDKLLNKHCYSADAQLERGLMRLQAGVGKLKGNGSDATFVRHYQGRWTSDGRVDQTYQWVRDNVDGFDQSKVVIPFTHDWGQCLTFDWNVWRMREKMGNTVPAIVKHSTAWSVMGDMNSPCYRPHQDVVIPPRTCLSPMLLANFSTIASIKPALERRVLATFSGTPWGTGLLNRQRLQCTRPGWHWGEEPLRRLRGLEETGPDLISIWGHTGEYDYMGILNNTIFCPQAAGTTGWATRLSDSIAGGCIPVLIGHATHPPFFDILDWSKFSVRVEPHELSQLEDILLERYSASDVEKLQTNLLLVRDAFVYPLDEMNDREAQSRVLGGTDENERRGPLFWALHATKLKQLTRWPVDDVYDQP